MCRRATTRQRSRLERDERASRLERGERLESGERARARRYRGQRVGDFEEGLVHVGGPVSTTHDKSVSINLSDLMKGAAYHLVKRAHRRR